MSDRLFRDRRDAGRVLVGLLEHYQRKAIELATVEERQSRVSGGQAHRE